MENKLSLDKQSLLSQHCKDLAVKDEQLRFKSENIGSLERRVEDLQTEVAQNHRFEVSDFEKTTKIQSLQQQLAELEDDMTKSANDYDDLNSKYTEKKDVEKKLDGVETQNELYLAKIQR